VGRLFMGPIADGYVRALPRIRNLNVLQESDVLRKLL
jgi:hypothetical protein